MQNTCKNNLITRKLETKFIGISVHVLLPLVNSLFIHLENILLIIVSKLYPEIRK